VESLVTHSKRKPSTKTSKPLSISTSNGGSSGARPAASVPAPTPTVTVTTDRSAYGEGSGPGPGGGIGSAGRGLGAMIRKEILGARSEIKAARKVSCNRDRCCPIPARMPACPHARMPA
jgi:hypothetical protein